MYASVSCLMVHFTLPDTDTETDTIEMCTEPMEVCIGLSLGSVETLPNIIIEPSSIGLCLDLIV